MKSMIIATNVPIANGSEFRAQVGHGGTIEITVQSRIGTKAHRPRMGDERVLLTIPKANREALAQFIKEAE